jgi:hypothetical protein
MDIGGLFHSPDNKIAAFARIQALLYRQDETLQDYFQPLQMDLLTSDRARPSTQRSAKQLLTSSFRLVDRARISANRRKIKVDALICPNQYFGRETETQFFIRTVLGVAETGATILCLMPSDARCRTELLQRLDAIGRAGQVEFLDPAFVENRVERRLRWKVAQVRGRAAFNEVVGILEPHGLSVGEEVRTEFDRRAYAVEAWERLEPWIEFNAAIVRCHWFEFGSSICRTAAQRGKISITFQQGVIGHSLDVPVTASKFVTFGQCSSSFLERANRRFFHSVAMPETPVEYVDGGCLVDKILDLPDQFDNQTLLVVDAPTAQANFYGVDAQGSALLRLADKLLCANLPLRRVVIRPHPFWSDLDFGECKRLAREHPNRCEISHPAWSLEEDLRRSSVVVGIFSGVLTVASASGLPTIFLQTEGGYTTGDLECFSPSQTLLPDGAFYKLSSLLSDRKEYAAAREEALRNASVYYKDGKTLDMTGEFFERLFRSQPNAEQAKEAIQ